MPSAQDESNRFHNEYYENHSLFEIDTWLERPNAKLLDIGKCLVGQPGLHVLDLGSGVGRNAIPLAKLLGVSAVKIECVDILQLAVVKLKNNALLHGVSDAIAPILSSVVDFEIVPDNPDAADRVGLLKRGVRAAASRAL